MLKIRDDVDLKELEKFGFKYVSSEYYDYYKKVYLGNDNDDRVFYKIVDLDRMINIIRIDGELDDTLYDLIKADLVETVDGYDDKK